MLQLECDFLLHVHFSNCLCPSQVTGKNGNHDQGVRNVRPSPGTKAGQSSLLERCSHGGLFTQIRLCPRKQSSFAISMAPVGPLLTPLQIDLARLCDLAFDNLKSQLNEKNIIQELFSPFTAELVLSHIIAVRNP